MKNKCHGGHKNRAGFAGRALLMSVLALGLFGAALFPSNAAGENATENPSDTVSEGSGSLDLGAKCKLTVVGNTEVTSVDLQQADVVVDLYKVAGAEAWGEWYSFKLCDPFLQLDKIPTDLNAQGWQELAQEAAGIVLNSTPRETALKEDVKIGDKVGELEAGLYLLIARGSGTQDYVEKNDAGDIVTRAVSEEETYIFQPVLVAVPRTESMVNGTQTDDSWQYDVTAVLKAERKKDVEYGSLKIVKTLNGFAMGDDPATFVFKVEAVLGGKKVYSNVVTLVFDKEGKKELLVKNIPVGAEVKVTEVYSGASYSLTSSQTQTVTIPADQIPAVTFTNRYDERENGGGSITNHFEYDESGELGEWKLQQRYDESQG